MRRLLPFLFAVMLFCSSYDQGEPDNRHLARGGVSLGFWNVENFFDTIPSLFYDDKDYTPGGRQAWNTERYNNKLRNIAAVLDELQLDVVGLCEIENESVVYDLVMNLDTDYNYIHRTAGRARGRDIALLYKGDKFIPHEIRTVDSHTSRTFLYVRGELCGERVDIVVVHLPSMLNKYTYRERAVARLCEFTDSLHRADPESRPVVMGDFNATPGDRVMRRAFAQSGGGDALFSPFEPLAANGAGTYAHNNRWLLYDNIFVSQRLLDGPLRYSECGIFIREHMLCRDRTKKNGYPLRTFTGRKYTNGYSDHLPVYILFGRHV